jgi:hypothetical protein
VPAVESFVVNAPRSSAPKTVETPLPTLSTALERGREQVVATMVALSPHHASVSGDEVRQFAAGFLHLVEAAAAGDTTPRDEYLGVVIPGVRASGFPLDATLDAMVRVSMALVAETDPEHHRWLADFCGDYTCRLLRAWNGQATP